MLPSREKRSGAPLTENEKLMIINTHKYFSKATSDHEQHQKLTLRKRVALVLGVSEGTIASVVADWNRHSDGTFSVHKILGRPKLNPDDDIKILLRNYIIENNNTGKQISTLTLQQFLSEHGHTFSKWKIIRILHRLGYYYGRGERRNILHEAPNNVAFRCCYIRHRMANLEGKNNVPRRPEVFLDESYCHLNHTHPKTWLPQKGVVLTQGHGPLLIIFGAIIVFRNGSTNKIHGELVPNSVYLWDPAINPPGTRGRKRNNAEEWDNVPDIVKTSNIVPNQVDYHGNFNAEIFEDLFAKLCQTISETYGATNIHMDGARYHKRRIENVPTSATKKKEIIDWLTNHHIPFSNELRKPELLELVKKNKEQVPFTCVEIAKQYNHQVFFTPPYHCELQPIEGVWAVVKGEVARSGPHSNLLAVRNKLLCAFKENITPYVVVGLWRRAVTRAKEYKEMDENVALLDDDSDDDDDFDSDNEL
jgi:transposase